MPRSCVIGRVRLGRYVLSDAITVSLLQDDIVNKCRVVEEAVEFQTPVTNIQGKNRLWYMDVDHHQILQDFLLAATHRAFNHFPDFLADQAETSKIASGSGAVI